MFSKSDTSFTMSQLESPNTLLAIGCVSVYNNVECDLMRNNANEIKARLQSRSSSVSQLDVVLLLWLRVGRRPIVSSSYPKDGYSPSGPSSRRVAIP